jgi:two-component system, cell cycle response regulator
MRTGGHTTVIQRLLERRAEKPPTGEEGTTATVAVMLRVLPPPKALLVVSEPNLRREMERRITPDLLDLECVEREDEALRQFAAEFRPVVLTDSLELIRKIRSRPAGSRAPFIVYLAELDEASEREAGLTAGSDECVGRRSSERELTARIAAARHIAELESVLRITMDENRKLSATDDLTRVASRRFFVKHFPREVERAARYGLALSLIVCDIDHFKKLNETLGHPGGDQILRQFGSRLQQVLRRGVDWVARIGGEEFAVILPETPYGAALDVARKLRAAISQTAFKAERRDVRVTASFGLCGMDCMPTGERRLANRMLKIADAALYRSKQDGRNRVTATVLNSSPSGSTDREGKPQQNAAGVPDAKSA